MILNKFVFTAIFFSITCLNVFGMNKSPAYMLEYECLSSSVDIYLNDFLIESYTSITDEKSSIYGYNTAIMQFLKQKGNILKLKIKPFNDSWNNCTGKISCKMFVNEQEKWQSFISLLGSYKMVKDKTSKRYKQSFSMECSHLTKNLQVGDEREVTILFDTDKAVPKKLLWDSEKRILLTKRDNEEMKNSILKYSNFIVKKEKNELIKLYDIVIKNLSVVYGEHIKDKYISEKIDKLFSDIIAIPQIINSQDIVIVRLGNNLFRAKQRNKDYLFKIPIKLVNEEAELDEEVEVDEDDDYEEPELEEQDNITFDLFFSKIDGRWQIVY